MTDLEIIAAVNELARGYCNAELEPGDQPLPPGTRCDMHRAGFVRRRWERAREVFLEQNGLDVLDAIKRHEAWLRSPENAPQLYVDRR